MTSRLTLQVLRQHTYGRGLCQLAADLLKHLSHQSRAELPERLPQDVFRPPQQPITRRRSGGDARSMKTRRAENNRRAQQRWRDRQKVDHMSL
jgi:hypothetical protein